MTRYCNKCGAYFDAEADWQRLCWECWKRKQSDKERQTYDRAYDAGYQQGFREGHAQGSTSRSAPTVQRLNARQLRALIQLCHPDRHPPERSALANNITGALLAMLEQERTAA